ncbi:hypothetical protein VNO77_42063 [Canavalia gladiata]|uniref:TF-B3 domain-containing protein n=1 Tax=Canavalia gladiata TaxID=3824 RepID=A0AAN9K0D0_CANGL
MIPRSFVKQYGKELSNPVIIRLPNGDKWEVCWTKRDNDIWFQKGWEKFAQHYSLSHGHFLVFRYERGFHFHVLIFKESALEIDYPISITCNDDDFVETDENEGPTSPSPQPHKKMKINTWTSGGSFPEAKNWTKTEPNKRKSETLEDIEGSAYERAKNFQSENPFFIRILHPSYLQNILIIPACFSRKYMKGLEGKVTIVVCENKEKTWNLRFKFNVTTNRTTLSAGWMSIVQEHSLKEGDVCYGHESTIFEQEKPKRGPILSLRNGRPKRKSLEWSTQRKKR